MAERVNRALPLPTNAPGVTGRLATLEDVPGLNIREESAQGPPAPRRQARTVHAEQHPAFLRAAERRPEQRRLRAAAMPGWRLETDFGVVLSPDGEVLAESSWGDEQLVATRILSARRLPQARPLAGILATLISQWCEHYYHWLADAVPRLLLLERLGLAHVPLIVPARVSQYQRDSLGMLGVANERIVPAAAQILRPNELVWPAFAGPSGHPPALACREIGERLRAAPGAERGGDRRLFISRRLAAHRRVINEPELVAALAPFGFEIVTPEQLSFAEQVRLFAEAQVVVAPHGAGLANMLFSTGATAVEIHEPDNLNLCFYNLADASGHDYWYVLGERFTGHAVGPSYRDVRAPVAAVVETVEAILG